ncbi:MAG: exodeoxyribonuclease VII large subunit [Desulfobulbaceae bacterium]|nr:exodeoxyribonuclease VII large subunit [Desulfobulbaceae bacterium]
MQRIALRYAGSSRKDTPTAKPDFSQPIITMLTAHSVKVQSVSELTSSIRGLLETEFPFVTVSGEISNLRRPQSGHYYFILKDRDAQLRSVLFQAQQKYLTVRPADGLAVVVRGRLSVYEARGEYQLLVDTLETKGTGDLQAEFELLKKNLAAQGFFAQTRKRPLPLLPRRVALVTSPEGAAVHDFLRMTNQRFPGFPLEIFPVRVQGEAAPDDIVEALEYLNRRDSAEVIVLCRGGGSLEDLKAFNSERVARAIFNSAIPVVSAIGHEIDFTIADFVADYRAATPSAAAEAVIPDRNRLRERIHRADQRLSANLQTRIAAHYQQVASQKRLLGDPSLLLSNFHLHLTQARSALISGQSRVIQALHPRMAQCRTSLLANNPKRRVANDFRRTGELSRRLESAIAMVLERNLARLREGANLLDAVSPLAVLARGYSLARLLPTREVIRSAAAVEIGGHVEILFAEGSIEATVIRKSVNPLRKGAPAEE